MCVGCAKDRLKIDVDRVCNTAVFSMQTKMCVFCNIGGKTFTCFIFLRSCKNLKH